MPLFQTDLLLSPNPIRTWTRDGHAPIFADADPFLAPQKMAIFGKYLYVDNVDKICHPHPQIRDLDADNDFDDDLNADD